VPRRAGPGAAAAAGRSSIVPTQLVTLAAVLLLGGVGWRIAGALLPREADTTRAALALVLGAALLCSGYGILGQLCVRHAAEVELVFHGDTAAAPRSSTSEGAGEVRVVDDRVDRARATPSGLLVFAAVCAGAAALVRVRRSRIRRAPLHRALWLLWIPTALAALAALRSTPRGYDALWYHLPTAAAFAQNGHLEPPGRDLVFYFPGNLELLARTLFDLTGRPGAMTLVQLPFALALPPLCTALARRLGAGGAAVFAGALALACPIVVFQAGLAYADVLSATALAAALLLLVDVLHREAPRPSLRAVAAGACLGLALGAKYAAIPLIATGLPVLAACARRPLRALAVVATFGVGVSIPAWFWYLRNTRLSGNPIFPIAVPSLGLRGLFLGDAFNRGKELELVRSHAEWWVYPWLESLSHESGFGAAFATLVPIALAVLGLACARALLRRRTPRLLLPLGWGAIYLVAWWLGTPHEVRHLLPLVVLFGAPATLLLRSSHETARGLRLATSAALALSAVFIVRLQLWSPVPELSAHTTSFERLYDLSEAALSTVPDGARVANLAGRPYNFALFGPRGTLLPFDYAPDPPSLAALADRGATHVLERGAPAVHPDWTLLWRGSASPSDWQLWGTAPTDTIALWRIPAQRLATDRSPSKMRSE
jgi:hypothetical protein